jgi:hypothetical protein
MTPDERKAGLRAAVTVILDEGRTVDAVALLWRIIDSLVDECEALRSAGKSA